MALVILSAGAMTQSRVRTLSLRTSLGIASVVLLIVASAAFAIGLGVGRSAVEPVAEGPRVQFDQPEGRALIDRVGEISGRLVRLESDASTLAQRIGLLKEFEARQNALPARNAAPSVFEGARPATPAGGPMLAPLTVPNPDLAVADLDDHGTGLAALERELQRLDATLLAIEKATDERNLEFMTYPSRSPVPGVARNSGFGNREDPFNRGAAFHSGLDFPAPTGTPIVAAAGGRVVYAGIRPEYGYTVEIDHGNGLVTRYAHCSRLWVKVGEVVTPGRRIAAVGSTGRSTGPHLHFEVLKDGRYSDPALYLASN
ncbi:M23 family metallopeptidase [Azoarcus olearius]|uniref:Peptidase n=1 Tax=Azoarcus sp. (strain BH72) TaxID=418699 RepID=A1K7H8_AZOSB|nr:M23 family metallopeptidase [Azoarcus olearius]ANQ85330.1 peptidase [Azoarcus olearius]CAL94783.1 peptidase [Azoarcus olearius]